MANSYESDEFDIYEPEFSSDEGQDIKIDYQR